MNTALWLERSVKVHLTYTANLRRGKSHLYARHYY